MDERTNKKTIAIVGGTGKVGRFLIQKSIENNYKVKILMRNPEKMSNCKYDIDIVKGDAIDKNDIRNLLKDCNVVINTVGQPPNAEPIYSRATENILNVMKENGIRRYIVVSGAPVNDPRDKKDVFNKFIAIMMRCIFSKMMIDKQKELEILMKSDLDWTLVRLPLVKEGFPVGKIKESLECVPGTKIDNMDIADFLINQITKEQYIKCCPFISG